MTETGYRLGVDIGGTFTDAALVDGRTGTVHTAKALTTERPELGALEAIAAVLARAGANHAGLDAVVHATTLASNVLLQRRGARVALLTTDGFQDVLRLRREVRYDSYALDTRYVAPVVEPRLCRGVRGRLLVDGTEYEPLDVDGVRRTARDLRAAGVESVAVCLMHSYQDPAHERRAGAILAEELGADVPISLSSSVNPQIREYERASTTALNAYVQPAVGRYQGRFVERLAELDYRAPVHVMLSSGGVATAEVTSEFPVRMLESGPVAGALAAARVAAVLDEPTLVALDIGGTTAKACLIRGGEPSRAGGLEVDRADRHAKGSGLPVQIPSVDLIEVGAGGGSIAWIDAMGFLRVGPQSAESHPGPACYGLGGSEPTVTDANLILGYLKPARFADGSIWLDVDAANRALGKVAEPLGLSVRECALRILETININMAGAVRVHLAEHGQDPATATLLGSGGGGPLHAAAVARRLGMSTIVIPPRAGVLSATGLLVTPPAVEFAHSLVTRLDEAVDWDRIEQLLTGMQERGVRMLAASGVPRDRLTFRRFADLRWVGQTHELTVELPAGPYDASVRVAIEDVFDGECEQRYGAPLEHTVLEAVTWRVTVVGPRPPDLRSPRPAAAVPAVGARVVHVEGEGEREVPVYDRDTLPAGFRAHGPALVEEAQSTCLIGAGDVFRVDEWADLVVTVRSVRNE